MAISNNNSFRVLFDKMVSMFFIWKIYQYFSIVNRLSFPIMKREAYGGGMRLSSMSVFCFSSYNSAVRCWTMFSRLSAYFSSFWIMVSIMSNFLQSEKNRIQVVNSAVCISKAAAASLPPTATNYVPVHPSLALPRVNTFLWVHELLPLLFLLSISFLLLFHYFFCFFLNFCALD